MESTKAPRDLKYRSILSLMDMLQGSEELAQQAAEIVSHLDSSPTGRNRSIDCRTNSS